jgi:hypothetical protein
MGCKIEAMSIIRVEMTDRRFAAACDAIAKLRSQDPAVGPKIEKEVSRLLETLRTGSTGASEIQQQERHILEGILDGFDMETSQPYLFFRGRGYENLPVQNLVSIAEVFSTATHIPMHREAKRRKPVLFKWFADNWDTFHPIAELLVIEWADGGKDGAQ